jgi:hypothetical protein
MPLVLMKRSELARKSLLRVESGGAHDLEQGSSVVPGRGAANPSFASANSGEAAPVQSAGHKGARCAGENLWRETDGLIFEFDPEADFFGFALFQGVRVGGERIVRAELDCDDDA